MSITRTSSLMRRIERPGRDRDHRDFPGQANLTIQALYSPRLRSHVHRPGPAWHGPVTQRDPAVVLLEPRRSTGRRTRMARAAVLLVAVLVLSPVMPILIT